MLLPFGLLAHQESHRYLYYLPIGGAKRLPRRLFLRVRIAGGSYLAYSPPIKQEVWGVRGHHGFMMSQNRGPRKLVGFRMASTKPLFETNFEESGRRGQEQRVATPGRSAAEPHSEADLGRRRPYPGRD